MRCERGMSILCVWDTYIRPTTKVVKTKTGCQATMMDGTTGDNVEQLETPDKH